MPSDPGLAAQLEIAHVLFMDIVEYSRLPMEEQTQRLAELQEIVRSTGDFRAAQASADLIRLPTGDGMALVFFRDPVAPVRCAIQIARAAQSRPYLNLRIGLHSGPVYRVEDINANANVSGGGINIAQRVMDCGDAGHILLSSAFRELLGQVGAWPLHDLGECEVKHGLRLHLYNLCTDEIGNQDMPAKLRAQRASHAPPTPPNVGGVGGAWPGKDTAIRVALLYKRGAHPDEDVLRLLEAELAARGCRVFIDRHLAVGVEWAKVIERQIREAGAVVPLLSAASIESEMLAYEVQIARDTAEEGDGTPRLLPVRVAFTGPLPDALASILDPLEYALWESPDDDERLVADLAHALRNPQAPTVTVPLGKLEPVGGAVPLDSKFYVVRATDDDFGAAIERRDSVVLIKGARQMGKTSLLARGLQQARAAGAKVVLTDLQKLNAAQLETPEAFYLSLAESIADQLDLDVLPDEVWNPRRGPNANFERYVRREVLGKLDSPLVWGLDEVDRLFAYEFGSEVFGLFRAWHNERALNPDGPWARLTLAIAYATEAHLFITDMNQSPFNVGTRLVLQDFDFAQVMDLNRRYGAPLRGETEEMSYYRLVGGHPYLVRRGFHEMVTRGIDLGAFGAQADKEEGVFGDHLRRILMLLARDAQLLDVVRGVLRGRPCPTAQSFYRLRSAGIIAGESPRDVRPRCGLYSLYLERHLL